MSIAYSRSLYLSLALFSFIFIIVMKTIFLDISSLFIHSVNNSYVVKSKEFALCSDLLTLALVSF